MIITQTFTPSLVWAISTRTITGHDGSITTNAGLDNQSIANGTTVNFTATAGTMNIRSIVGIATANATYNVGLTNGTTLRISSSAATGAAIFFHAAAATNEGPGLSNTGTVAGAYSTSAVVWNT